MYIYIMYIYNIYTYIMCIYSIYIYNVSTYRMIHHTCKKMCLLCILSDIAGDVMDKEGIALHVIGMPWCLAVESSNPFRGNLHHGTSFETECSSKKQLD